MTIFLCSNIVSIEGTSSLSPCSNQYQNMIHFNSININEHIIIGMTDKYFMNNEFSWRH